MKPVCVPCQRFYRPKHNGYAFLEGMPSHNGAKPGKAEPESWSPYKLWMGDLWACPDCGSEIVVGTGLNPIAEHYQITFANEVERHGASRLLVKDC